MNILNDHDAHDAHDDAHDGDTIKTSGIVPVGPIIKILPYPVSSCTQYDIRTKHLPPI